MSLPKYTCILFHLLVKVNVKINNCVKRWGWAMMKQGENKPIHLSCCKFHLPAKNKQLCQWNTKTHSDICKSIQIQTGSLFYEIRSVYMVGQLFIDQLWALLSFYRTHHTNSHVKFYNVCVCPGSNSWRSSPCPPQMTE